MKNKGKTRTQVETLTQTKANTATLTRLEKTYFRGEEEVYINNKRASRA